MDELRLALFCDYQEEGWPSMDLCADRLAEGLEQEQFKIEKIRPRFIRRWTRIPAASSSKFAINADRFCNRFYDYPRFAKESAAAHDLFHISDHSYAQLALSLPGGRTGIYCHDLDTFRSVIAPETEPRPAWFRMMTQQILAGFRKAAILFCSTSITKTAIEKHFPNELRRIVIAPLGISGVFQPQPAIPPSDEVRTVAAASPFIINVGSCIARKRIDLLIQALAELRRSVPALKLIKVGGSWQEPHRNLIKSLNLENAIIHFAHLAEADLAELSRRAELLVVTSEAEGFCLPIAEALACGTAVVASDLPALREVGGEAVVFFHAGSAADCAAACRGALTTARSTPLIDARVQRSSLYSWKRHARIIADAYRHLFSSIHEQETAHSISTSGMRKGR